MTAADTLNRILAGQSPWLAYSHENPLVRALAWKRLRWTAEATVEDCGRNVEFSHLRDAASDDEYRARDKHRHIIQSAWDSRRMERRSFVGRSEVRDLVEVHS